VKSKINEENVEEENWN